MQRMTTSRILWCLAKSNLAVFDRTVARVHATAASDLRSTLRPVTSRSAPALLHRCCTVAVRIVACKAVRDADEFEIWLRDRDSNPEPCG